LLDDVIAEPQYEMTGVPLATSTTTDVVSLPR
jgi:hypothetical protein